MVDEGPLTSSQIATLLDHIIEGRFTPKGRELVPLVDAVVIERVAARARAQIQGLRSGVLAAIGTPDFEAAVRAFEDACAQAQRAPSVANERQIRRFLEHHEVWPGWRRYEAYALAELLRFFEATMHPLRAATESVLRGPNRKAILQLQVDLLALPPGDKKLDHIMAAVASIYDGCDEW